MEEELQNKVEQNCNDRFVQGQPSCKCTDKEREKENIEPLLDMKDLKDCLNSCEQNKDNLEAENGTKSTQSTKDRIWKEDIELPRGFKGKLAFVLHNVLTKEECDEYIKLTEKKGYAQAELNIGGGRQMLMTDVRNSHRCIWDSEEEAAKLWERIKDYVPSVWNKRKVMGLNERLRFLRYDPGEYFKPHQDGTYQRENGERSYVTIQLYLNEGFKGGSTTFMNWAENELKEVVPKPGLVLVFQHDILHEGSVLVKGRKYAMRTDVMYSAVTS